MFIEKRTFKNSRGLKLSAVYEGEDRNVPVVVLCHGFGSSKDAESTKGLAQKLVEKGLCVFRFDFTGCGDSDGKLEDLAPSRGLDDLKSSLINLGRKDFALYGSSFGGCVSLMYASRNPVLALGLKAPVSDYFKVQELEFSKQQLDQFLKETGKTNLYEKVKKIKVPTLIVHGDKDNVVPLSGSRKLLKFIGGEKQLEIITGADHKMRGEFLEKVNNLLADFFQKVLI